MSRSRGLLLLGSAAAGVLFLALSSLFAQASYEQFPEIPPSVLAPALQASSDPGDPMNSRLFRTTTLRPQIQLEGFWDFITDPNDQGESSQYFVSFPKPETRVWIPGSWNTYARYWHYEGAAWFQRAFEVPASGELRIRFAGVFYRSKVWLDGKLLGEHEGGYTPFTFLIPGVTKGAHRLVVLVDNRLDDESLPKQGVDWFPYGGIYRSVYAELVPDVFIDYFWVKTPDFSEAQATLEIQAFLRNASGQSKDQRVELEVDGKRLYSGIHRVTGGDTKVTFKAALPGPRTWSPDSPYLYSARLLLPDAADDQYTRFGVRSFKSDKCRILLNGEAFKFMGANHHDDHPDWGPAMPPHIIRQDIEILKRMGANGVRSHYPTDEMFLDYCDEVGLVFFEEVPAWQYSADQMARAVVQDKIKTQLREMVDRDMNHPSIFVWSLGNEWPEFSKSYDVIKSLIEYAHALDSSRFITFVTGGAQIGPPSGLVDIISTNWAQYQWYEPFTTLDPAEGEKSIGVLNQIHEQFPDKPVILTEFGGAESQAGWHNWGNVKWSEEYQARNVSDSGRFGLEQDWISGGFVWQFSETRSAPERFLSGRLRGWNSKGVVDPYRSPKLAFYKLQELFRGYQAIKGNAQRLSTSREQETKKEAPQPGAAGGQR